MQMSLLPVAEDAVERFYLVTGAMRTGSTMVGRLLRSLKNFEVFHEPAVAYTLFPLIDALDSRHWKMLFTSCIFEDCLIGSLGGTALNMNRHNESFLFHSSTVSSYRKRVRHNNDHEALVELSKEKLVAIKIPEMMPYIERYKELFPDAKTLITLREPEGVIASLLVKGYFSDQRTYVLPKKWPNLVGPKGSFLPFWLKDNQVDRWLASSEADRCCLAYIAQYETYKKCLTDGIIDYDEFCNNPRKYFDGLAQANGWEYGGKTEELLSQVRPNQPADSSTRSLVSAELLAQARSLYQRIQESSDFKA